MIRRYGVLNPQEIGARRAFFLIDGQGIVRGKWLVAGDEVMPSETILKAIRELVRN